MVCSLNLAKIIKDLGYPQWYSQEAYALNNVSYLEDHTDCLREKYNINNTELFNLRDAYNIDGEWCAAPELHEIQEWIKETYDYDVYYKLKSKDVYTYDVYDKYQQVRGSIYAPTFTTCNEALEAGIIETLSIIKNIEL